LNSEVHGQIVS